MDPPQGPLSLRLQTLQIHARFVPVQIKYTDPSQVHSTQHQRYSVPRVHNNVRRHLTARTDLEECMEKGPSFSIPHDWLVVDSGIQENKVRRSIVFAHF